MSFFPKEFVEENDYIEAMLTMIELTSDNLFIEKKDNNLYKEVLIYRFLHGKDINNNKIVLTFSKKTNRFIAGLQGRTDKKNKAKTVYGVVDAFYSHEDSYINILKKVNTWLGEMFKHEKNN
ncbi:hypothetical protein D3C87_80770 [compost metagenome]